MSGLSLYSRGGRNGPRIITPPANPNHWKPGNYISQASYDSDSLFNAIAARLAADAAGNYRGVLIRKPWNQLEAGLGDYNAGFDALEARLAQIAALAGRRLIIFIQIKTFNTRNPTTGEVTSYKHAVPGYMRASATYADPQGYTNDLGEHGEYGYKSGNGGPGGYIPNMHVAAVRDRFQALMEAFATRFNSNEYLEAVVINEASIAEPYQVTDAGGNWTNDVTWYANMKTAHIASRAALENIQISQWFNGPRNMMSTQDNYTAPLTGWIPDLAAAGIGLGMPDLAINDRGFQYVPPQTPGGVYFSDNPGSIYLIQQVGQGNAIVIGHASKPTYEGSVANTKQGISNNLTPVYPGPEQTRQETQAFAKNTVGVTHLCWVHNTSADPFHPGMSMNEVTDAFIANPGSDISTITTRPTGW